MNLGVIARATDRGLGVQTWEVTRHLPCSVLIPDCGEDDHLDRYESPLVVGHHHTSFRNRNIVREWVAEQDVIYTAETFYDPAFTTWSRQTNTATVCHLNPEFWIAGPQPTAWWTATPWRLDEITPEAQVVPFPVATEHWTPEPLTDGPCRWLHIGGKRAGWDRNGTDAVLQALEYLTEPCHVTIASQSDDLCVYAPPHVTVELASHTANYWDLYPGHDMAVMPRRYGGLCLPVQEAMGAGLGVLMPDISPNAEAWPVETFPAAGFRREAMYAGHVPVAELDPRDLAAAMDRYADPVTRHLAQLAGRGWADAHSWERQAPLWLDRLEALCP